MENQISKVDTNVSVLGNFDSLVVKAEFLSKSTLIPEAFRNKPHDVFVALSMAEELGMNPFMVMQNMFVVYGKASWSSSFIIACINKTGKFSPLEYEFRNDTSKGGLGCRVVAKRLSDGKVLEGSWVTWEMVEKEGWSRKPGSKWNSIAEQMFRYRAAAFWQRVYAPEATLGFRDVTEEGDIEDAQYTEIVDTKQKDDKHTAVLQQKAAELFGKLEAKTPAQEETPVVEEEVQQVAEEVEPEPIPAPSEYPFASAAAAKKAMNDLPFED